MSCPFCEILEKERERVIEEKDKVIVFLSNPRLMKGHTLVIPKRHVEKFSELTEEERRELVETLIEYQERILDNVAPGCDIRRHYRPFIGEIGNTVDHLHFHLQPRELADELWEKCQSKERKIFKKLSEKERKKVKKLLQS